MLYAHFTEGGKNVERDEQSRSAFFINKTFTLFNALKYNMSDHK